MLRLTSASVLHVLCVTHWIPFVLPTFYFPPEAWRELGNAISEKNTQEIEGINKNDWLSLSEVWSTVVETNHW